MAINLYVDDDLENRPTPTGWTRASSAREAIIALSTLVVTDLSLDHDLGKGMSGYDICLWMVEHNKWPLASILLHTGNVVGRDNMRQLLDRYAPKNLLILG